VSSLDGVKGPGAKLHDPRDLTRVPAHSDVAVCAE
jgi:hypothetical protein